MTSIEAGHAVRRGIPGLVTKELAGGLERLLDPSTACCYHVGSAFHGEYVEEWSDIDFLLFFRKGTYSGRLLRELRPLVSRIADRHEVPVWVDVFDGLDLLPKSHYFGLIDDEGRVFGTPFPCLFDVSKLHPDIRSEAPRKLDAIVHDFRRRYTGITRGNPTLMSTHVVTRADWERVLAAKCIDTVVLMVKFIAILLEGRVFFGKEAAMAVYERAAGADVRARRFLEIRGRWGGETSEERAWAIEHAPDVVEGMYARWRTGAP